MTAQEFVDRLKILPRIIENCELQKQKWEDKAQNTTSGGVTVKLLNKKGEEELHNMEKVCSSSDGDSMAVAGVSYVDLERKIEELKQEKAEAEAIIEKLPPKQYDVLYKFEILEFTLYEISDLLRVSYSSVSKLHSKALKNLQKLLEGAK
jgi:RNA polymerase sigma factor (sigma-70 family)